VYQFQLNLNFYRTKSIKQPIQLNFISILASYVFENTNPNDSQLCCGCLNNSKVLGSDTLRQKDNHTES